MEDEVITTADLLVAWREATRAAELAQRLATLAAESAAEANEGMAASEEIVRLAEAAANAAEEAAATARQAADRARTLLGSRASRSGDAEETLGVALQLATQTRERYHDAEREAERRHRNGAAPAP